jgi:predicted ATPase with chaperone activity
MLFPLEYATVSIITLKVSYVTSMFLANCCQPSNCFYFSQNTRSCVKHITLSHHPTKEKQQIDYSIGPTAIHDVVMYAIN